MKFTVDNDRARFSGTFYSSDKRSLRCSSEQLDTDRSDKPVSLLGSAGGHGCMWHVRLRVCRSRGAQQWGAPTDLRLVCSTAGAESGQGTIHRCRPADRATRRARPGEGLEHQTTANLPAMGHVSMTRSIQTALIRNWMNAYRATPWSRSADEGSAPLRSGQA